MNQQNDGKLTAYVRVLANFILKPNIVHILLGGRNQAGMLTGDKFVQNFNCKI